MRRDSKKKNIKIILVVFIAFIMVSSIFGYLFSFGGHAASNNIIDSITYKDTEFQLTNQGWAAQIHGGQVFIANDPRILDDITIPDIDLNQEKVYIGFPPNNTSEFTDFLNQRMSYAFGLRNIRAVPACSYDSPNCPDVPIINCNTGAVPSIVFGENNESSILQQESCIIVDGNIQFKNRFIDKLTLQIIGL